MSSEEWDEVLAKTEKKEGIRVTCIPNCNNVLLEKWKKEKAK